MPRALHRPSDFPSGFFQEHQGRTWGFVVALPLLTGSGCASQEEAARRALDAIVRADKLREVPSDCEWRVRAYLEAQTAVSSFRPPRSAKPL